MEYKLPPLPTLPPAEVEEWSESGITFRGEGWKKETVEKYATDYAIAAIEAQAKPCCMNFAAGTTCFADPKANCPRLASAPPAPQASGWSEETGLILDAATRVELACYEQGTGECIAAVKRILDGKDDGAGISNEPWESVRRRLIALVKQASVVQQEPLGFISPKQVERIVDPEGEFGAYIPMRRTPAGNFTLAVYTHPAQQAKPQPLSDEQRESIRLAIGYAAGSARFADIVRAIEAAHGIQGS